MRLSGLIRPSTLVMNSFFFICSCSPQQTFGTPNTVPEPKRDVLTKNTSANGWAPTRSRSNGRYVIRDSSEISISNDTLHSSLIQTITILAMTVATMGDSFTLDAKVESLSTLPVTNSQIVKNSTALFSPLEFYGVYQKSGQLSTLTQSSATGCLGGLDPVAARIQEVSITNPAKRIRVGDKWTDTVSVTTCRGRTPLFQQTIRDYELLELLNSQGREFAKIRRTGATTLTSPPRESKNEMNASGSGTSSAMLLIERGSSSLISSDGKSYSTLTVNTSRGSYPFTQNVITHIELK